MRLLKFNVKSQLIMKDPDCDFSGLVAGTKNYLKAYFTFSSEWDNCILIASFWRGSKEYAVVIENNCCCIPEEVLVGSTFSISITGQNNGYRITTNKVSVNQEVNK